MLKVADKQSLWRKFSNNLDKHGDDDHTSFDVPGSLELNKAETNSLFGDKLFHQRVFDSPNGRGKPTSIGDGFKHCGPFKFQDVFEDCTVDVELTGTKHHFEGCKVSKITLAPCHGGTMEMDYTVHLKPTTDKQILLLLHHQRRSVVISIFGGKQIAGGKAQGDLDLDATDEGGETAGAEIGDGDEHATDPRPVGGIEGNGNVQPIR